jgi:Ran GTPase-activating protein (RanGAP) involved in mRNA processing and transport
LILRRNAFCDASIGTFASAFSGMNGKVSALKDIDLTKNEITAAGTVHLARLIGGQDECGDEGECGTYSLQLTTLSVADNALSDAGVATVCTALQHSSPLQSLNLGSTEAGEKSAFALSKALAVNSTLTSLDLAHNSLGSAICVEYLASGLSKNVALKTLNLSHNGFGDAGAVTLAPALYKSCVSDLQVGFCQLTGLGIQALLGQCSTSIDDAGGESSNNDSSIFRAGVAGEDQLQGMPCLERINFLGNQVGNAGVAHFAGLLDAHPTLKYIGLSGLGLTEEGIVDLISGLATNAALETIELGGNSVGPTGQEAIVDFLARRTSAGNGIDVAYDKFSQNDPQNEAAVAAMQQQQNAS